MQGLDAKKSTQRRKKKQNRLAQSSNGAASREKQNKLTQRRKFVAECDCVPDKMSVRLSLKRSSSAERRTLAEHRTPIKRRSVVVIVVAKKPHRMTVCRMEEKPRRRAHPIGSRQYECSAVVSQILHFVQNDPLSSMVIWQRWCCQTADA